MRFQGQVALVTGAAIAQRLVDEGAQVAAIDREPIALPVALAVEGDCTDPAALEGFVAAAEARLGPPDILVNNVGQSARERGSLFCESREEVWRFVLEVSLFTTMRMSPLVAPGMAARGYGRILSLF